MKFLSFLDQGRSRLGLLKDDGKVVDLSALLAARAGHGLPSVPADVGELIELGGAALDTIEACLGGRMRRPRRGGISPNCASRHPCA